MVNDNDFASAIETFMTPDSTGSWSRKGTAMSAHAKYDTLIAVARALPRLKVAVVHPCDESAIKGALEAAELGLIEPILVGPTAKIVAAAASCNCGYLAVPDRGCSP